MYILLVHCSIIGIKTKCRIGEKTECEWKEKRNQWNIFFYFQVSIIFSLNRIIGKKDTAGATTRKKDTRTHIIQYNHADRVFELVFVTSLLYGQKSMLFGIRRLLFFQTRKIPLVSWFPKFRFSFEKYYSFVLSTYFCLYSNLSFLYK